jgi:type VI protein secretion system component VasF
VTLVRRTTRRTAAQTLRHFQKLFVYLSVCLFICLFVFGKMSFKHQSDSELQLYNRLIFIYHLKVKTEKFF